MINVLRDARMGVRFLRKSPAFATVAILTLALGIAANTAIFSVIYATFFAPLPYRDPDRLVMVWSRLQGNRNPVSPGDYLEWKQQSTVFEDLNAWSSRTANLASGEYPEQVQIGPATPGFLPMLGYGHPLALGRDFLDEEGTPGRDQVVILTHRVWRERYGADRDIVGRQIRIDRKPYTVVGVLAAGPADENQNQLWVPLAFSPEARRNHDSHWLLVMGRLKTGITLQQANANMSAVSSNLANTSPASGAGWSASVEPFRNDFLSSDTKRGLWLLLAAVGFVLLIACANVANLLLARGTARQREVAVRASLGASRSRIMAQLLVENLMLAIAGGALGVALASVLLKVVITLMPPYMLPTEANVRLNLPVLLFALFACGLSAILFGAAPAWQAARANVNEVLKEAARSVGGAGTRLRHALVVVEFALALTLLTGGGLAIRGLFALATRDLGFRADHLLTFYLPVERTRFTEPGQIAAFYYQLLQRVQALPGVISATVSTGIPVRGPGGGLQFSIVGQPPGDLSTRPVAGFSMVSPDYFSTFGMRLTRGRPFTDQDRAESTPVAIVNEAFVRRYLPDVDPLNQRVAVARVVPGSTQLGPPVEWQIVGVCADIRNLGPAEETIPEIDVPFWQSLWPDARVAVRTAGDPTAVQRSIAAAIQSLDHELPMADVKTMEQIVSQSLVRDRFNTVLFGSFAVVGLLLAAFGIYGVMSFVVAQRTHEIGLRMALGAARSQVLRQIVREGMTAAAIGAAVGSAGAFYAARTMKGIVSGIIDLDPIAFVAVTMTLLSAALIACVVPAMRAASVDPMIALRRE